MLIVSHYLLSISCKTYNYIFEFVTVMSNVQSTVGACFPEHGVQYIPI